MRLVEEGGTSTEHRKHLTCLKGGRALLDVDVFRLLTKVNPVLLAATCRSSVAFFKHFQISQIRNVFFFFF